MRRGVSRHNAMPSLLFRGMALAAGAVASEVSDAFDLYWNDRWSVPFEHIVTADPTPLEDVVARFRDRTETELFSIYSAAVESTFLQSVADGSVSAHSGTARIVVDHPDKLRSRPGRGPAAVAQAFYDTLEAARDDWTDGAPVVPIIFYRALVQGGGLSPINRMTRSLLRAGLNPLPIFVASLKDPVSAGTLQSLFDQTPPTVVLNATSFAVSAPQTGFSGTPLDLPGVPVMQTIFSGGTEEAWNETDPFRRRP